MSQLSYLEKLLDGVEVEVEWKTLGELGELVRGNGLPKADFTTSGVPAIHYGQIYTHYGLSTETTISYVSPETARKLKKVNTGDVVITNTSENLEDVGKALVYLGNSEAVTGGHATIFKPNKFIIGKYFAYFTQTSTFFSRSVDHFITTSVYVWSKKTTFYWFFPIKYNRHNRLRTINVKKIFFYRGNQYNNPLDNI